MSSLSSILLTPPLILLSVPLFFLAILTTSLAFLTLGVRVSIIYVELFASVLQNILSPSRTLAPYIRKKLSIPNAEYDNILALNSHVYHTQPSSPNHTAKSLRRTSSTTTTSSLPSSRSGNTTPKALSSASNDPLSCSGIYMSGSAMATTAPLNRDFEGVGGWRMPIMSEEEAGDAEREEELWTGMNKRLELPVPVPIALQRSAASSRINLREESHGEVGGNERKHKRSATAGTSAVGKRMKDGVLKMAGGNSRERAGSKSKRKEADDVVDPNYEVSSADRVQRRNKSMITLGDAWTRHTGRAVGTVNGL